MRLFMRSRRRILGRVCWCWLGWITTSRTNFWKSFLTHIRLNKNEAATAVRVGESITVDRVDLGGSWWHNMTFAKRVQFHLPPLHLQLPPQKIMWAYSVKYMDFGEEEISNGVMDDIYLHAMLCVVLFIIILWMKQQRWEVLSVLYYTVDLVLYAGNMLLIRVVIMIQKIFKSCETVLSLSRGSGLFQKHLFVTGNFAVFDSVLWDAVDQRWRRWVHSWQFFATKGEIKSLTLHYPLETDEMCTLACNSFRFLIAGAAERPLSLLFISKIPSVFFCVCC